MGLKDAVLAVLLQLIRTYKWIELQGLRLIAPWINKKAVEIGEGIGVVFHVAGEKPKKIDDKKILSKCKYESVIHIKVNDPSFFIRVANQVSLAFGEGYMNKLWESNCPDDMTQFTHRILENNLADLYYNPWNRFLNWLEISAFNLQTPEKAWEVGKEHYDLGNDLFEHMLDPWMQYTCGYWAKADNLDQAQIDKMDLLARKLDLKPGMRVLDIGCGWGKLCKYLAENYGVSCVGVTISKEGMEYGRNLCKGLDVDIRLQDYRDVSETFDRIVSVGMFEHVGYHNYKEYFQVARKCLVDDGIFLLHTIGNNHQNMPRFEPWLHKYIFPNGSIPYTKDITEMTEGLFIIEDWHNFGLDYAKTLEAWRDNFIKSWPQLEKKYGERFYRMWVFYLSLCAGLFKARRTHLWQIVLSKDGLQRDYRAAR